MSKFRKSLPAYDSFSSGSENEEYVEDRDLSPPPAKRHLVIYSNEALLLAVRYNLIHGFLFFFYHQPNCPHSEVVKPL